MKSSSQVIGALTLTIASIILLSGIWCYYLSPTVDRTKVIDSYKYHLAIEKYTSRSITFPVEKGETITITVRAPVVKIPPRYESTMHGVDYYYLVPSEHLNRTSITVKVMVIEKFNVKIFDPDGELISQELNVEHAHFRIKALKSGTYKVEIENLVGLTITVPVHIIRTIKTTIRPLEPGGQWLSIISLPIFAFGIWMIIVERKKSARLRSDCSHEIS